MNLEVVYEMTVQDSTALSAACPEVGQLGAQGTLTGSVDASAIAGTQSIAIIGKDFGGVGLTGTSGNFSATLPTGSNDIAAVAYNSSSSVLGIKILRSQTVPGVANGGNPITLATTDAVTTQSVTTANTPTGFTQLDSLDAQYNTGNLTGVMLNNLAAPTQYAVVPTTEAASGDWYSFSTSVQNTTTHQQLGASENTTTPGAVTLTYPAPMTYTAPTAAAFPTMTIDDSQFSASPYVTAFAQIQWAVSGSPVEQYSVSVTATSAYLNGATTLTIPNLTSLAGFFPTAASNSSIVWTAQVSGSTAPGYEATSLNSSTQFAAITGTYAEP